MKKYIFGLLVWNLFLTVFIGYGVYEARNAYNLLTYNMSGLVKIAQDLHDKQKSLTLHRSILKSAWPRNDVFKIDNPISNKE